MRYMAEKEKFKKKDFRVMSGNRCTTCGAYLKQNLVDKIPFARYCWTDWRKLKVK